MTVALRMSINSGALVSGGVVVNVNDAVLLSLLSTVGLTSVRYEIYSFPPSFTVPSGWSTDTTGTITGVPGAYYYTSFTPPSFSITQWGKYLFRALGNQNTTGSNLAGLTDDTSGVSALSPVNHLEDLAYLEDNRFNAGTYATAMKKNLRLLEASISGATGGTFHYQIFNAGGTWTAPLGVTMALVYGMGAGGGGGGGAGCTNASHSGAASSGGGGGGGARASLVPIDVVPSTGYAVGVGAPGSGGTAGAGSTGTGGVGGTGGTGGNSTFGANLVFRGAVGGIGGTYSTTGLSASLGGSIAAGVSRNAQFLPGFGGAGGIDVNTGAYGGQGTETNFGGDGGEVNDFNGAGGGGGASNWRFLTFVNNKGGDGGVSGTFPTSNGNAGSSPGANSGCGGGGGGAGGKATGSNLGGAGGSGAAGGSGCVIVIWVA